MTDKPDNAKLLALLSEAELALMLVIRELRIDPEVAAAACAALAGEYAASAAIRQGLPLAPLLREAAQTLRQRGDDAHRARTPGAAVGSA